MTKFMQCAIIVAVVSVPAASWDCYDQKCGGTGSYEKTYINCDNAVNRCGVTFTGYPSCDRFYYGVEGYGCNIEGGYTCSYDDVTGEAHCPIGGNSATIGLAISIGIFFVIFASCCCYCYWKCKRGCCRRRTVVAAAAGVQQSVVVINAPPAAPQQPNVIQNINMVQAPTQPFFPQPSQPGYTAQPQPGYTAQPQPGYATQPPPGYAAQPQPGYAAQPQPCFPNNYSQPPGHHGQAGYAPQPIPGNVSGPSAPPPCNPNYPG